MTWKDWISPPSDEELRPWPREYWPVLRAFYYSTFTIPFLVYWTATESNACLRSVYACTDPWYAIPMIQGMPLFLGLGVFSLSIWKISQVWKAKKAEGTGRLEDQQGEQLSFAGRLRFYASETPGPVDAGNNAET